MLQVMNDLPPYVVGVKATGEVTKDDYESIMIPAIESASTKFEKINFLMVLETDLQNFTVAAWMHDAWISFKKFTKWNRIAVVTDQKIAEQLTNMLRYAFPGDSKGFTFDQLEQARSWVTTPATSPANGS